MTALPATAPRLMPAGQRFRIATASSLAFHALLLVFVGLSGSRPRVSPELLIPIEMTTEAPVTAEAPIRELKARVPATAGDRPLLALGAGNPRGKRSRQATPAFPSLGAERIASSGSGKLPSAPAPPRILTSNGGTEPSGPIGQGRDPAGPGGKADVVGGPSYGAGIEGGGGPLAVYPKDALDRNLEGTVTVSISVGADGSMESVSVPQSSGHALLDEAALRAVRSGWAFKSAMQNGKPVAGTVSVTFVFSEGAVKRG